MKINIYGTKDSALSFILRNKDIEINKFIDGKLNESDVLDLNYIDSSCKYQVIPLADAKADLKKYHTVICSSPETYWEIKKDLESLGLVEFDDFEYFTIYRKKIAVCYGNCNAHGVKAILEATPNFYHNYGFYPISPICELALNHKMKDQLSERIMNSCDLFLYQDIRENNMYGAEFATSFILASIHNDNCQLISIPNYFGMPKFMFPQTNNQIVRLLNVNTYSLRDVYIDTNCSKMNVEQLCEIIDERDIIDHSYLIGLYDEFREKLINREKDLIIKTASFIFSHFRDNQLFYDLHHPTEHLLSEIANNVLQLLGLGYSDKNYCLYKGVGVGEAILDMYEIPIYNSVKKVFDMSFNQYPLRKSWLRSRASYCVGQMPLTLKQYVENYLAYNYRDFSL